MQRLINHLNSKEHEFIFNTLGIANHSQDSQSQYRFWFDHFKSFHDKLPGDVFEFGVYRGHSLISIALLAKRLGSDKTFYGFDTFSGFSSDLYHENDLFDKFSIQNNFSTQHIELVHLLQDLKLEDSQHQPSSTTLSNPEFDHFNDLANALSSLGESGTFSNNSLANLQYKINKLGLDNIVLIPGVFTEGIAHFRDKYQCKNHKIFSANIDCDLYQGYSDCLDFISADLVVNGYVHLDEFYSLKYPGARIAVDEFLHANALGNAYSLSLLANKVRYGEFPRYYLTKTM